MNAADPKLVDRFDMQILKVLRVKVHRPDQTMAPIIVAVLVGQYSLGEEETFCKDEQGVKGQVYRIADSEGYLRHSVGGTPVAVAFGQPLQS